MKLADFHYDLPAGAIAQEPLSQRDESRLMVLDRSTSTIQHHHFKNLVDLLKAGDVLVLNATKVFPARLRGKKSSGGKIELLLIEPQGDGWKALVRGTTKKAALEFPEGLKGTMEERLSEGEWRVHFSSNHIHDYLERHGEMPLPPYIKRPAPRASDLARYQTVYAADQGAIAAPTAGFHFTDTLLAALRAKGIEIETIVLHVGWGTFRPVRVEDVEQHRMLPETYEVSARAAEKLNAARRESRRIIAVGTTVVRTLESSCDKNGVFQAGKGQADLFIYPGYHFKAPDALITNFHLPDSTPLFLASAFYSQAPSPSEDGRGRGEGKVVPSSQPSPVASAGRRSPDSPALPPVFSLRRAYEAAIHEGYRFYSYGDAMFIQ